MKGQVGKSPWRGKKKDYNKIIGSRPRNRQSSRKPYLTMKMQTDIQLEMCSYHLKLNQPINGILDHNKESITQRGTEKAGMKKGPLGITTKDNNYYSILPWTSSVFIFLFRYLSLELTQKCLICKECEDNTCFCCTTIGCIISALFLTVPNPAVPKLSCRNKTAAKAQGMDLVNPWYEWLWR